MTEFEVQLRDAFIDISNHFNSSDKVLYYWCAICQCRISSRHNLHCHVRKHIQAYRPDKDLGWIGNDYEDIYYSLHMDGLRMDFMLDISKEDLPEAREYSQVAFPFNSDGVFCFYEKGKTIEETKTNENK